MVLQFAALQLMAVLEKQFFFFFLFDATPSFKSLRGGGLCEIESPSERYKKKKKKKNLFLGYITPPFGLVFPNSSNPRSVGWQKCNSTSSL
jgi:hypothetical protein